MSTDKKSLTAEDFANAMFATSEDGGIAMRFSPGEECPWAANDGYRDPAWFTDEEMAKMGWNIVTSSPETPEDALAHFISLLHEPEADTIPAGTPYVAVGDSGDVWVHSTGFSCDLEVSPHIHRLLFHPLPATETEPELESEWDKAPAVWVKFEGTWDVARRTFTFDENGDEISVWEIGGSWIRKRDEVAEMDPRPVWKPES